MSTRDTSRARHLLQAGVAVVAMFAAAQFAPQIGSFDGHLISGAQAQGQGQGRGAAGGGAGGMRGGMGQGGQRGGAGGGSGSGVEGQIFHDQGGAATPSVTEDHGQGGQGGTGGGPAMGQGGQGGRGGQGGVATGGAGSGGKAGTSAKTGGGTTQITPSVDEDSDRPAWAGVKGGKAGAGTKPATAGTKKGDLYGDLYVIQRDENGVPILVQTAEGTWVVQPVDASGNPLPLNPDGTLVDPTAALTVEFSRLSVAKAPTKVLTQQYNEAISALNTATSVTVDAAGRLVVTNADGTAAIDSPLENLALYQALLSKGYLPGLTASDAVLGSLTFLKAPTDTTTSAFTEADYKLAASLLGAASDKTGKISVDTVAYMDTFLKIGTLKTAPTDDGKTYVDFSAYTYDRESTYSTVMVTYLVANADGTYSSVTKSAYEAVFNKTPTGELTNIAAFSTAADDSRTVIQFIHDNSVPTGVTSN